MIKKLKKKKTKEAIAWMRINNVDLEEVPDGCLEVLGEIAPPSHVISSDRKNLDSEEVVSIGIEWLRNIEEDADDVDNTTMKELTRVTGVRIPKKLSRKNKKNAMKDVTEWFRDHDQDFDNVIQMVIQKVV